MRRASISPALLLPMCNIWWVVFDKAVPEMAPSERGFLIAAVLHRMLHGVDGSGPFFAGDGTCDTASFNFSAYFVRVLF